MSKKPSKVNEPQTPYAAKKPAPGESGIKYADPAKVREANAKLIKIHGVVLEKLARA